MRVISHLSTWDTFANPRACDVSCTECPVGHNTITGWTRIAIFTTEEGCTGVCIVCIPLRENSVPFEMSTELRHKKIWIKQSSRCNLSHGAGRKCVVDVHGNRFTEHNTAWVRSQPRKLRKNPKQTSQSNDMNMKTLSICTLNNQGSEKSICPFSRTTVGNSMVLRM